MLRVPFGGPSKEDNAGAGTSIIHTSSGSSLYLGKFVRFPHPSYVLYSLHLRRELRENVSDAHNGC